LIYALRKLVARTLGAAINLDRYIQVRRDRYVFGYHRVITEQQAKNDGAHNAMWITPQALASQIRWMKRMGEVVDYSRILDTTIPNGRPLFALTFDDGWKDTYDQAFPVLKHYDVPAIVFLATDAVNSGALFWPEDVSTKTRRLVVAGYAAQVCRALMECWPEKVLGKRTGKNDATALVELWIEGLKRINENERRQRIEDYFRHLKLSTAPLTGYIISWNEARKMQKHGIDFGSHTHHHTILKGLPTETIEYELRHSRALIAEKLQIEVDAFCYPNARYNGKEGAILSRCGYRYGFCLNNKTLGECTDNFYIPRFLISEKTSVYPPAYLKLRLLNVPLYRSKPHNPHSEQS
jgi:peptidoglycan/xylan/chitin deacetylase (PgdA/CDA1 family)